VPWPTTSRRAEQTLAGGLGNLARFMFLAGRAAGALTVSSTAPSPACRRGRPARKDLCCRERVDLSATARIREATRAELGLGRPARSLSLFSHYAWNVRTLSPDAYPDCCSPATGPGSRRRWRMPARSGSATGLSPVAGCNRTGFRRCLPPATSACSRRATSTVSP
jgi:hypothetical protein